MNPREDATRKESRIARTRTTFESHLSNWKDMMISRESS